MTSTRRSRFLAPALAALFALAGALGPGAPAPPQPAASPGRRVESFNRGWRFARGAHPGAEAIDFDDSSWQPVRLPHDWAIAGPYEPDGDPNTGKLPWRGEGWYRKRFVLPPADAGKRVYLDFAGVGNGDHHFPAEFDADAVDLFYGKAMLILRAEEGAGGAIRIEAEGEGLGSAAVSIESR